MYHIHPRQATLTFQRSEGTVRHNKPKTENHEKNISKQQSVLSDKYQRMCKLSKYIRQWWLSVLIHIIQICSEITRGRALNGELYTQRF